MERSRRGVQRPWRSAVRAIRLSSAIGIHMSALARLFSLIRRRRAEVLALAIRRRGQMWRAIRLRERPRTLPWRY
jgi:hypothetical protein